jgi:hypothetical protein
MSTDKQTAQQPEPKAPWHSRTIQFNAICLALAAAEPLLPALRGLVPGGLYTVLAFVVPVGNAYLRGLTKCPLRPWAGGDKEASQ